MAPNLADFQKQWENLVDKARNYQQLSQPERVWYNIQTLLQDVDNGGLISHYYNPGADHLETTTRDLESIGASDVKDLLQKVNDLFPSGRPPADMYKRNEVINSWQSGAHDALLQGLDESFYRVERDVEKKLIAYITENDLV